MPKSLVIVESPAKAKTINKYLGKDYEVEASLGHIKDLPKSKLGVDLEGDFSTEYDIMGYDESIDYSQPPPGPLTAQQIAWVEERLRSAGRRK